MKSKVLDLTKLLFFNFIVFKITSIIWNIFKIIEKNKVLGCETKEVARCLNVANRLFYANKELKGVGKINWGLTIIENDNIINASAFPVLNLTSNWYRNYYIFFYFN